MNTNFLKYILKRKIYDSFAPLESFVHNLPLLTARILKFFTKSINLLLFIVKFVKLIIISIES